jgi:hypothetical protein
MRNLTHVIKHQVNVTIVLCSDDVHKADDVVVTSKLLQVHDFTIRPLGVRGIAKRVETLLQCNCRMSSLVCGLPHDAVCLKDGPQQPEKRSCNCGGDFTRNQRQLANVRLSLIFERFHTSAGCASQLPHSWCGDKRDRKSLTDIRRCLLHLWHTGFLGTPWLLWRKLQSGFWTARASR